MMKIRRPIADEPENYWLTAIECEVGVLKVSTVWHSRAFFIRSCPLWAYRKMGQTVGVFLLQSTVAIFTIIV